MFSVCFHYSAIAGITSISAIDGTMSHTPCGRVCHQESMEVSLQSYARGSFGLMVHDQFAEFPLNKPVFISYIEKGSPAEKCGVLQIGDRILSINGWPTSSGCADEANQIIRQSNSPLILLVEFDVIECSLSLAGILNVKLAKRGNSLGIIVRAGTDNKKGEPVIISDIKIGSVAYRCGSLKNGDRILAIDNIPLDSCTVEEAVRLLQRSGEVVKLKLRKCANEGSSSLDKNQLLIYTIELNRKGGRLGITIASSAVKSDIVVITHLAHGGLAERTGALKVGDRILAVNNKSVEGLKIGDVMRLLQHCGDTISLKISRHCNNTPSLSANALWPSPTNIPPSRVQQPLSMYDSCSDDFEKYGTPVQSIDSAVESLEDSSSIHTKNREPPQHLALHEQHSSNTCALWLGNREWGGVTNENIEELCGCQSERTANPENWMQVLETLQTVVETEFLRKLDECSVESGSPSCMHGSPSVTRSFQPDATIMQRVDPFHVPCSSLTERRPYLYTATNSSSSPSPAPKSKFRHAKTTGSQFSSSDRVDSLSISNDSQTSCSLCNIPCHTGPPKPPRFDLTDVPEPVVLSEHLGFSKPSTSFCISPSYQTDSTKPCVQQMELTSSPTLMLHELSTKKFPRTTNGKTIKVKLRKDHRTNSFGFSVSDGVGSNIGVYINAILPGGPADRCGQIAPYDKILKVNDTSLQYLDCDLALPLLNVDEIDLVLFRESPPLQCSEETSRSSLSLSSRNSAV